MILGQRLRGWRRAKGLHQFQLAEKSGLSRAYISMLESSDKPNPSKDVIDALVRGLGITLVQFYGKVPAPKKGFEDRASKRAAA